MGLGLCFFIQEAWQNNDLIKEINNTLLVLLPKINILDFIYQFKPISLCNVAYKCITKLIVNRLKSLLGKWVSPFQANFVPGRNIHDNIIIAHELFHTMDRMRGKKGFMSIKIDIEKAYDRLSLRFIRYCLEDIHLPPILINIYEMHIFFLFLPSLEW